VIIILRYIIVLFNYDGGYKDRVNKGKRQK